MPSYPALDLSELRNKSVLITGAGGCIGAWAIKLLNDGGAHPVALDISDDRSRLDLIMEDASKVTWELGDITDYESVLALSKKHDVQAIIHLAALQVPYCKADPVGSTAINVMGSIHMLETARQLGLTRLTYASSIAAPAMHADNDYLATLYGAHKVCGEQMAAVYWQDWQVPSIGIRPCVVYGPGRDRGMSAAPTIALLAAWANRDYTIPFTGPVTYVHAEDAAARFVAAICQEQSSAPVFNLDVEPTETQAIVDLCNARFTKSKIKASGGQLPFPANSSDGQLDAHLGLEPYRDFRQGIEDTLAVFANASQRNVLNNELINELIERNL